MCGRSTNAEGLRIGQLQKIRDLDLMDPNVSAKMKERCGMIIPMEEIAISPGEMFSFEGLSAVSEHRRYQPIGGSELNPNRKRESIQAACFYVSNTNQKGKKP